MNTVQLNPSLKLLLPDTSTSVNIPFINGVFSAGFSSPADDYIEDFLDLNKKYVVNEPATVMLRITGNSMCDAGINNGDVIIVDKSLEPRNNKIAVCVLDGGFLVKRLRIEKDIIWLMPENHNYFPIKVTPEDNFSVWGIVTTIIKEV